MTWMRRIRIRGPGRFISALTIVALIGAPVAGTLKAQAASTGASFVQAAGTTAGLKLAFTKSVTAGALLVAGITTNDSGTDPVTAVGDSLNGSWARLTSVRYGNGHVELYYFNNSVSGTDTVTFTTLGGGKQAFTIAEYAGVTKSSPVDQFASAGRTGGPSAGPTAAIGGSGELVIGSGGMSAPSAFSAGTGFTMRAQAVSNYLYANAIEDSGSSSPAGQSITMTPATNSAAYSGAIVAVFRTAPTANPQAALTVNPPSGPASLSGAADASDSIDPAGISTYTFAFGDGTTVGPQVAATANHVYTSGGNFTATASIKDNAGLTASAAAHVTVGAPVAALTVISNGGLAVTASASASTDPIGISTYTFSFGDGSAPVGPQAGATANHSYAVAGSFTVTVTVKDSTGATSSASAAAVVQAAPPTAKLSVSPSSGPAPLAVSADASASTPGSNPISSFSFNFGDGSAVVGPQAGPTARHTYSGSGRSKVTVPVKDSSGSTATATAAVTVSSGPTAALTVTPASGAVPLAVSADASTSTPGSNPHLPSPLHLRCRLGGSRPSARPPRQPHLRRRRRLHGDGDRDRQR